MNWTQIILTLITTIGTVLTAALQDFASDAKNHADVAKAASLRPPRS